jgi:hypothetical protein
MPKEAILSIDRLTPAERQELRDWRQECSAFAAQSDSWRLNRFRPKVFVLENKGHYTRTNGHIFITRDLLNIGTEERHYFLGRDLGAIEGYHHWMGLAATVLSLLCLVGLLFAVTEENMTWSLIWGISFLFWAPLMYLYRFTMFFEWDVDRRGARLVGKEAYERGMTYVAVLRGPRHTDRYANKLAKLQGSEAGLHA